MKKKIVDNGFMFLVCKELAHTVLESVLSMMVLSPRSALTAHYITWVGSLVHDGSLSKERAYSSLHHLSWFTCPWWFSLQGARSQLTTSLELVHFSMTVLSPRSVLTAHYITWVGLLLHDTTQRNSGYHIINIVVINWRNYINQVLLPIFCVLHCKHQIVYGFL